MRAVQSLSFRNITRSKLILIAAFCSFFGCLILFLGLLAPFWFDVKSLGTYRHAPAELHSESMGLTGYVDYNGRWHNLNLMSIASSEQPFPKEFKAAQVLYISGFIVATVATMALAILALKPYRYFVSEVATTGALAFSVTAMVLAIILAVACLSPKTEYNLWPERSYSIRQLSWAAYISMLGTLVLIAALVVMVMETRKTCRTVERVRSKPKKFLEDEPLYYKFDYNKVPKVHVEPNPILAHAYTNPTLSAHQQQFGYHPSLSSSHPPTPSAYSQYSYGPSAPGMLYAPSYQPRSHKPPSYDQSSGQLDASYGDSDMERSSGYGVTVDEQGRRMVSM